jgi:heme/copper-type cytochrome/quinol oxidase subunit 3
MTNEDILKRPTLDVADLPATAFDSKSPLWWGNTLGLFIETTMFGILVAIYVTVAMNTDPFPPVRGDRLPAIHDSVPDLLLPTIGLIVLIVSLAPAIWLDLSARRRNEGAVKIAILVTLVFNIAAFVIRYYEFDALYFKWNDNAYGSITWMILGMHMLHIIVMGVEDIYLVLWTYLKGVDEKHALDLTVTATYWYWIVGVWILLFPLIYFTPRWI